MCLNCIKRILIFILYYWCVNCLLISSYKPASIGRCVSFSSWTVNQLWEGQYWYLFVITLTSQQNWWLRLLLWSQQTLISILSDGLARLSSGPTMILENMGPMLCAYVWMRKIKIISVLVHSLYRHQNMRTLLLVYLLGCWLLFKRFGAGIPVQVQP